MKIPLTGNGGKGSTPRPCDINKYSTNFTNVIPEKIKIPYFFNIDIPNSNLCNKLEFSLNENKDLIDSYTGNVLGYYKKTIDREFIQVHIDKLLDCLNFHNQVEFYFNLTKGTNEDLWYIYCPLVNETFASFKYNSDGEINTNVDIDILL